MSRDREVRRVAPPWQGQLTVSPGLLSQDGDKEDQVWHPGEPRRCVFILPCPVLTEQGHALGAWLPGVQTQQERVDSHLQVSHGGWLGAGDADRGQWREERLSIVGGPEANAVRELEFTPKSLLLEPQQEGRLMVTLEGPPLGTHGVVSCGPGVAMEAPLESPFKSAWAGSMVGGTLGLPGRTPLGLYLGQAPTSDWTPS